MLIIVIVDVHVFNLHFTSKSVVFERRFPAVHLYCPACDKVISPTVVSVLVKVPLLDTVNGELLDSVSVAELILFPFKLHDIVIVSLHGPVQDTETTQVMLYSVVLPITGTFEGDWVTITLSISTWYRDRHTYTQLYSMMESLNWTCCVYNLFVCVWLI